MILIDSNVLIDVLDHDPTWFDWSFSKIREATARGRIIINPVVVAEVAPRFADFASFMQMIDGMMIGYEDLSGEAAFAAGRAFQAYRQRRPLGDRKAIIADFLIGGHAQISGAEILTRDARFYRNYFSGVPLITPSKDEE